MNNTIKTIVKRHKKFIKELDMYFRRCGTTIYAEGRAQIQGNKVLLNIIKKPQDLYPTIKNDLSIEQRKRFIIDFFSHVLVPYRNEIENCGKKYYETVRGKMREFYEDGCDLAFVYQQMYDEPIVVKCSHPKNQLNIKNMSCQHCEKDALCYNNSCVWCFLTKCGWFNIPVFGWTPCLNCLTHGNKMNSGMCQECMCDNHRVTYEQIPEFDKVKTFIESVINSIKF